MTEERKIKVLIADVSGLARLILTDILNAEPDMCVADTADSSTSLLQKARKHAPDVIIVDVNINMNNRSNTYRQFMKENTAVLILCGEENKIARHMVTQSGSAQYDVIFRPESILQPKIRDIAHELVLKVRDTMRKRKAHEANKDAILQGSTDIIRQIRDKARSVSRAATHIIVIGSSTGGVVAIEYILSQLPKNFSGAIVIAQHMPPGFTTTFTRRLNTLSALEVEEGTVGTRIEAAKVIVAPGEVHMKLRTVMGNKQNICVDFSDDESSTYDKPSIDLLMQSAAQLYGDKAIGVILSGMGKDGSLGARSIREKGGHVLVQDQHSSVVFGMGKTVVDEGHFDKVLPLSDIPREIMRLVNPYQMA